MSAMQGKQLEQKTKTAKHQAATRKLEKKTIAKIVKHTADGMGNV